MNTSLLSSMAKSIQTTLTEHSPEILTGLGITGMVTATVLAVKATPKALTLMQGAVTNKIDKQIEDGKNLDEIEPDLTPVEVVKATWKCYIPAAVTCGLSIACLVGASSVHLKRNAALTTAYMLSETALKEYKDSVVETIGERKEQVVRDNVAKHRVEEHPVSSNQVFVTGKGETLCYDMLTDRYFKSDIEQLRKAENELNRQMRDDMYISMNDYFYEIGLNSVKVGDDLGWNIDRGYIDLEFSSQLAEDGTPCLVVGHRVLPEYDYR